MLYWLRFYVDWAHDPLYTLYSAKCDVREKHRYCHLALHGSIVHTFKCTCIMYPLSQRGGDMLVYLRPLSSSAQLVSGRSLLLCRWSNTRCWPNAELMLAHRLWRWPIIKPALVQRFVFAGSQSVSLCCGESVSIHFSPALSMVQEVKQETLTQCWTNVGPPSMTLSEH